MAELTEFRGTMFKIFSVVEGAAAAALALLPAAAWNWATKAA